jgi:uncharacterized membrane protein YjjP (DUF1212 family)
LVFLSVLSKFFQVLAQGRWQCTSFSCFDLILVDRAIKAGHAAPALEKMREIFYSARGKSETMLT